MINIILPIVENPTEYSNFIDQVAAGRGRKIFVGIRESLAKDFKVKAKGVVVLKYADNSKREEIVNALHSCNMTKGKILVARRVLSQEEFDKLVSSEQEIAVLKRKRNGFVAKFKRMMAKIIRKMFGFSYFEDISATCFSEDMFELVSVCSNLSMASRINRYIGINIEEIETSNKSVKKEGKKWLSILKFCTNTLFMLGSIAGVVLLSIFTKVIFVAIMFEVLWLVVAVTLWFIGLLNFSRSMAVGDIRFGRAEEKR